MIIMTTKKILSSFAVLALALSLAGCTTINNTASTNKKPEQTTPSKIVKNNNQKKASSKANVAISTNSQSSNSQLSSATSQPSYNATSTPNNSVQSTNNYQNTSVTTNQNSQSSTQKSAVESNDTSVLSSFLKANNMQPQSTDNYIVKDLGSNNYQIEIRTDNNDNSVSHLNGLYKYNIQTNQTQQFNAESGEWK